MNPVQDFAEPTESELKPPQVKSSRSAHQGSVVSHRTWRRWTCAVVALLFLISFGEREYGLFTNSIQNPSPVGHDFAVYYVAGRVARGEGGGRLYYPPQGSPSQRNREMQIGLVPPDTAWSKVAVQSLGLRTSMRYIYPPLFAWLFSPLARINPREAYFLWRGISATLLLLSTYVILKSVQRKVDPPTLLIACIGALSFFPFVETLYQGQVGCLILFLWTLGFFFARERKSTSSALCFALGTLIKLTPAIVVPIFLLRRQWRWLFSYLAAIAVLLGLSIWRLGWESDWVYVTQVLPSLSGGIAGYLPKSLGTVVRNVYLGRAVFGPGDSWDVPRLLNWLIMLANVGVYAGTLFYFWRKRKPGEVGLSEEVAIGALVSLIIAPLTWRHHYVLALLPLLYAWMRARETSSISRVSLVALATMAIGTPVADFILLRLHHSLLQALLTSVYLLASGALLWVCLRNYGVGSQCTGLVRSSKAAA